MNKIAPLAVLMLLSHGAAAQQSAKEPMCGPTQKVFEHFVDQDAAPTVAGVAHTPEGDAAMTIWQSPAGEQWVIIMTKSDGTSCVVQAGHKLVVTPFKPYDKEIEGNDA